MRNEESVWTAASRPAAKPWNRLRTAALITICSLAATLNGCGGREGADAHLAAAREAIDADAYDAARHHLKNPRQDRPRV